MIKFLYVGDDNFGGKDYINVSQICHINIRALEEEDKGMKAFVVIETDDGSYKFRLNEKAYKEFLATFEGLVIN
jgi:hypothetical protein